MRSRSLFIAALTLAIPVVATTTTVGAATTPPALAPHVADELLVGFHPGATGLERAAARRAVQAAAAVQLSPLATDAEKWTLPPGLSVEKAMRSLAGAKGVRFAEPNYLVTTAATSNDPYVTGNNLWGMYGNTSSPSNAFGSQAAEAWTRDVTGSRDIVIGVIDEGIQITHPDLQANMWTNPGEIAGNNTDDDGNGRIDDINGWDFDGNNASVYDGTGDDHGTHVAGTIGGVGGNGIGVAGVNWNVTMISAKFLGSSGGTTANAILAVDYITDLKTRHNLNIVATSNSWGGGGFSQGLLDAINRGGNAGILFIAAAGNSSSNNDLGGYYPSGYQCTSGRAWDCVVSVAAIDSGGNLASFSSFGLTTVDIGAPGVNVNSTLPVNSYGAYSGTSMATPHVSGAVALCASANPSLTAQQLRAALMASVTPTASLVGRVVNSGRLDVNSLVTRCVGPTVAISGAPSSLTATGTGSSTAQLNWTDGVSNESGYEIQRAVSTADVCGTYSTVGTYGADITSFFDRALASSTTYCYRVRATSTFGGSTTSDWSNVATVTTPAPPAPYVCSATGYSWVDHTVGGTQRALSDDASVSVSLGFNFPFYGTTYTSANVSSNGFLRLGAGASTAFTNTAIPNSGDPNNMVAAWWDDLNPAAGGMVWTSLQGSAPNRQFVASWVDVATYSLGGAVSFQIVLDEATGSATLNYLDTTVGNTAADRGASATVGVENSMGDFGTQLGVNQAMLNDSTAYRCTNVSAPAPLSVLTSSMAVGTTGVAYSQTMSATGGTGAYTWSATGLPDGLTINPSTGLVSGSTTVDGSHAVTVTVTDSATPTPATTSKPFTLVVGTPVNVTTTTLPGGTTGASYSELLAASGGATPYTWSLAVGTLPAGLTLSSGGAITGTLSATATTQTFTVQVTDNAARAATQQLTITVVSTATPGSFTLVGPKNLATKVRRTTTLSWNAASGATSYAYCLETAAQNTNAATCDTGWISTGTNLSVTRTLNANTTYFWTVKAINANGETLSTSGWWRFATGSR
ncbi:MAG: S8 family serine peptidase [Ilumatobacteraceae bacterium]